MLNVDVNSVIAQKTEKEEAIKAAQERQKSFEKTEFDPKHYLNTFIEDGKSTKEVVIRLLPFSPTNQSPFQKIFIHSKQVKQENGTLKWTKFMCPIGNHKGDKCPFCETSKQAKKLQFDSTNEAERKKYSDVAYQTEAKPFWVIRCIDRAHEDEGPKFWRFPDSKKGDGIWDKLYALFENRSKRGTNIFDLYEGKDIIITVKREKNEKGKDRTTYLVSDDETRSPLAKTEEQMEKWVNDTFSLENAYPTKTYDYLEVILKGEMPVFSKLLNKFISKSEADRIEQEAKIQEIQENLKPEIKDFSSFTVDTGFTKTEQTIEARETPENPTFDVDVPF